MKDSPRRYTNPFLSDEENDKLNFWNNPELEHPIMQDDFTTDLEDERFRNIPSDSFEKAKELYVDKNVMECQLPESIACYEESGFHVVKDICVDEGLSNGEKVLIDGDKHDDLIENDPSTLPEKWSLATQKFSHADCHTNADICFVPKEKQDDNGPFNCAPDIVQTAENCCPENSKQAGEGKLDSGSHSLNNASMQQLVSGSMIHLNQDQLLTSVKIPESNNGVNDINQQFSQIRRPNEEILNSPLAQTANMPNAIKPATISRPRGTEDPEHVHELPIKTRSAPNHQDTTSDNVTTANQLQRGEGESSFSMAGPVSGLITYSGPIASSGSISLRSDSSTTSVRSFAFPVLQTEWNSSPVRMAKADRSVSRKHHGWRKILLCCRF